MVFAFLWSFGDRLAEAERVMLDEVVPLYGPDALALGDPEVAGLRAGIGSVEQWVDSVDVLGHADRRAALQVAYRTWMERGL
ncbi:hypothetical protein [Actinomadura physcomitrii]|uniref:hypothetical protein n=1 Tax=Actinomadura physcomitrii TaxID=2650748 RepID=UPI0019228FDC|nr:hypothetical protein [Actinomadura physcomitrii]